MKRIGKLLLKILLSLIAIIGFVYSLVIAVLELRLIFSLEWIIYDNYLNGIIRYLFRALIALFGALVCFFEIKNINNKKERITALLFVGEISLLLSSIILLFTTTNYVGIISFAIVLLLVIFKNLIICFDDKISYKSMLNI